MKLLNVTLMNLLDSVFKLKIKSKQNQEYKIIKTYKPILNEVDNNFQISFDILNVTHNRTFENGDTTK